MDVGKAFGEISVIASAVIGLAIVAVLVSDRAKTASVLQAAGSAFSGVIGAAVSPVTGGYGGMAGGGFSSPY